MLHEKDEVLKVVKTMVSDVIKHSNKCRHDEYQSIEERCEELEKIVAMARQIEGDLTEYDNPLKDHELIENV